MSLFYVASACAFLLSVTANPIGEIDTQIEEINLSHQLLETINLSKYVNLKRVNLSGNKLEDIPGNLFENNLHLQQVILDENLLKSLPRDLFKNNKKLKSISMNKNKINNAWHVFTNLENLENVSLEWNKIKEIDCDVLRTLKNLKSLSLFANKIGTIESFCFSKNIHLQTLNLDFNDIEILEENLFDKNQNLERLNINENPLKRIPRNIFRNNRKLVFLSLESATLKNPWPALENLNNLEYLSLKSQEMMNCRVLKTLRNLKHFSISLYNDDNEIMTSCLSENLHLETFSLSSNGIEKFSQDLFIKNENLKSVNLDRNNLRNLSENIFRNNRELVTISLEGNRLENPWRSFIHLKKLENLKLASNRIERIDCDVLGNLENLKLLSLENNFLEGDLCLSKNLHLENLNLNGNRIKELHANSFERNHLLQTLSLDSNEEIKTYPRDIFRNNKELISLSLKLNQIRNPWALFENLKNLEILKLNGNSIEMLNCDVLRNLKKLKFLSLANNEIKEIPESCFEENENLELLNLGENPFKHLPDGLFRKNEKIQKIVFGDELQELPLNVLANLKELKKIILKVNSEQKNIWKILSKASSLETINLKIPMNSLTSQDIKSLRNLKNLGLRFCNIEKVNFNEKHPSLDFLDLSDNNIAEITADTFYGLNKLKTLILESNNLKMLPHGLKNLQYLHIANNSIEKIEISGLQDLILLDLSSNNKMGSLTRAFYTLNRLEHLYLGNSALESIHKEYFAGLTSLVQLDLSDNQISILPRDVFQELSPSSFTTLHLRENNITFLPNGLFNQFHHLESIDLDDNQLTFINSKAFYENARIGQISLFRNPLVCDCTIYKHALWAKEHVNVIGGECPHTPEQDWIETVFKNKDCQGE